jgi:hypothetical protein
MSDPTANAEATEAEATSAPTEPKEKVDHAANLTEAFTAVVGEVEAGTTTLTDEQVEALQSAYRDVPSGARAPAQGTAMQAVIDAGRADLLPAILASLNNLPKVTKSRAAKPSLPPEVVAAIEGAALIQAFNSLKESNPEAAAAAVQLVGEPGDHAEAIQARAEKALAAVQKATRGGSGDRQRLTETLADLIADGRVASGSKLTCSVEGVVANVRKDGTVSVKLGDDLREFDNLSGAAKAVKEHTGAKNPSVNGWDFFQYNGESVGKLRTK